MAVKSESVGPVSAESARSQRSELVDRREEHPSPREYLQKRERRRWPLRSTAPLATRSARRRGPIGARTREEGEQRTAQSVLADFDPCVVELNETRALVAVDLFGGELDLCDGKERMSSAQKAGAERGQE
jgi:hypothetical protein